MNPYVHPSIDERLRIYQFFRDGLSQAEIAPRLGRDKATISRELRRLGAILVCAIAMFPEAILVVGSFVVADGQGGFCHLTRSGVSLQDSNRESSISRLRGSWSSTT